MPNYSDPTLTVASIPAIHPQRVTIGQIVVVIAGLLAVAFAGYLYLQASSANDKAQADLSQAASDQSQLSALQPAIQNLQSYDSTGTALQALFSSQILWEQALGNLEQHLYKHMAVSTLQIDNTGAVTLAGTTPNFTDYAEIYSSFTDPSVSSYFSNVKPVSITKNADGTVAFGFTFTLNPSLLTKAASTAQ